MSKLGLKEPGFENGRTFQRQLENIRNYYAFKNLRLSMFLNHGQLNKRSKQFENLQR